MSLSPSLPIAAWRLQDAKAQFSALVDNAMRGIPQHITRRGKQAVVVVSEDDFAALQRKANSSQATPRNLVEHLLAMPKKSFIADEQPLLDVQPRNIDFS